MKAALCKDEMNQNQRMPENMRGRVALEFRSRKQQPLRVLVFSAGYHPSNFQLVLRDAIMPVQS